MNAGFSDVGDNVIISKLSSLYGVKGVLKNDIRVDDFCILKGEINIGCFVHISAYCSLSGVCGQIVFGDFSGLSNRVSVYTGTDNYAGPFLSNPLVSDDLKDTITGNVSIGEGALIGAHSVILPGVNIGFGATIGALCVVSNSIGDGAICVTAGGRPRVVGQRDLAEIRRKMEIARR